MKRSTVSKHPNESNGYPNNGEVPANGGNGHETNEVILLDENLTAERSNANGDANEQEDGAEECSSVVVEMIENDNEMETVSYDANVGGADVDCCQACGASCSSSLSNHSQAADFLDIDLDVEPEDEIEEEDYFDLGDRRNAAAADLSDNPGDRGLVENNLGQNEQVCHSPPVCVTPQLNDMMEQLPGPSHGGRGDEPEDEGVICQEAGVAVAITSCSTDCEACVRTDVQIVGVLPARVESDSSAFGGAGTSSYRRRSQFFSVGGPMGKQLAEETFIRNVPSSSNARGSAENDSFFILAHDEAAKLTMQIGPSACGATSVLNVLSVLKWNHVNLEQISYVVGTRTRSNGAPLAEYLLSRSVAGVSHLNLISAMEKLTWQQIKGRFFSMYPKRDLNISQWLLKWLKKGAVPVLTANLQRGNSHGQSIADAWHHQMVFGAHSSGVALLNPIEAMNEPLLQEILCSPSVLLVRAEDVHQHWTKGCDLASLVNNADSRWTEMNVLGQILCVIREFSVPRSRGEPTVTHIAIPACYQSGVTLFAPAGSTVWQEINDAQELPKVDENVSERRRNLPSSLARLLKLET